MVKAASCMSLLALVLLAGCATVTEGVNDLRARFTGGPDQTTSAADDSGDPEQQVVRRDERGFVGVDIGDQINDSDRRFTDFDDTVFVDPATLDVHFSDGHISDALGITVDPAGVYHTQVKARYASLAQAARERARTAAPEDSWVDVRTARAAAEQRRDARAADLRKREAAAKASRGYGKIVSSFFVDPSGGATVSHARLDPRTTLMGKRFRLVPVTRSNHSIKSGVVPEPGLLQSASLDSRIVEFGADNVLRVWSGNTEPTTARFFPLGGFDDGFLGIDIWEDVPGIDRKRVGVSVVNKSEVSTGRTSRYRMTPATRGGRQQAGGRRRVQSGPQDGSSGVDEILMLTDGRIDGDGLERTEFFAFLEPIPEDRFEAAKKEQIELGRAWLEDIRTRHARGEAVESLAFPTWKAAPGGLPAGSRSRFRRTHEQAVAMVRQVWAGQSVTYGPHLFVAFQLEWEDLNPDPDVPTNTYVYTKPGYVEVDGFGREVLRVDPIVEEVVVRAELAESIERVYPRVMENRPITRGLRRVVRMFHSVYPPGSPTAVEFERRLQRLADASSP